MKRITGVAIIALCIFLAVPVFATTYEYNYTYAGSYIASSGLEHQKYYSWGLNTSQIPQDEEIVSVTILFKGLYNWNDLENHLYVHVLGDAPTPLSFGAIGTDNPGDNNVTDNLSSWNRHGEGNAFIYDFFLPWLGASNATIPRDVSQTFTNVSHPSLINFFNGAFDDGNSGLGFDPDCHFWGSKIKLKLITEQVPEPGTIVLLGSGLLAFGLLRKKILK